MAHNPKLNVYIISLKPKKQDENKTFRDFLKEKYAKNSDMSDKALMEYLFTSFINGVGQDEFHKDDKSKKVIGIDDGNMLPMTLYSDTWMIDGVIEGGKYGILREYQDTEKKEGKTEIKPNYAVLDKYYILLNPILNDKYAVLLTQSYTDESIQGPINEFIRELLGGCDNYFKVDVEPFVPKRLKEKYEKSAAIRMFSFTSPLPLSESLRKKVTEAAQEFEVEVRIRPVNQKLPINSEGTREIMQEVSKMTLDQQILGEGKGRIYTADEQGRNANYDISKDIQSIRPTIYLSDEGITSDEQTGLPDFKAIQKYCHKLLKEIKAERNINQDIYEF